MRAEFRRTCRRCGKVWHSLQSREAQVEGGTKYGVCGFCGDLAEARESAAPAVREGQRMHSAQELARLRQCPECTSQSYEEELLHD